MNSKSYAKYADAGFTLIELLITMTIFGLVLSSAVLGLRSGIVSWRGVQRQQAHDATLERAMEFLRSDIESIHIVNEEVQAISETSDDVSGDTLSITVLGRVPVQDTAAGFVWATIKYRVGAVEGSDRPALVREIQPMAGPSRLSGGESETALLEGVRSVRFGYISQNEPLAVWQDNESLPRAIEIHVEFDSAPSITRSFPVMIGMLNAETLP